jgi:hypothetical protein
LWKQAFVVDFLDRDAKKHLPRPKVGDFCSRAMEDGFKDACYALCQGEKPVPRIAQACRAAAIELPRPTVRKWCEHGYKQGFGGTIEGLKNYFSDVPSAAEDIPNIATEAQDPVVNREPEAAPEEPEHHHIEVKSDKTVIKTIQITLDEETLDLYVYEDQSAEEAVAEFCAKHMSDDLSACIRQLLPTVLERMEE